MPGYPCTAPYDGQMHKRNLSFIRASSNSEQIRVDTATNMHPLFRAAHVMKCDFSCDTEIYIHYRVISRQPINETRSAIIGHVGT